MPEGVGYPPPQSPRPMVAPGSTAPATVAPDSQGLKMRGQIKVGPAMKALEQALSLVGSQTEEGQALLKALSILGKTFGTASGDMTRAEIKYMGSQAAPMTAPNTAAIQARLQAMGIGGGGAPTPQPAQGAA